MSRLHDVAEYVAVGQHMKVRIGLLTGQPVLFHGAYAGDYSQPPLYFADVRQVEELRDQLTGMLEGLQEEA